MLDHADFWSLPKNLSNLQISRFVMMHENSEESEDRTWRITADNITTFALTCSNDVQHFSEILMSFLMSDPRQISSVPNRWRSGAYFRRLLCSFSWPALREDSVRPDKKCSDIRTRFVFSRRSCGRTARRNSNFTRESNGQRDLWTDG